MVSLTLAAKSQLRSIQKWATCKSQRVRSRSLNLIEKMQAQMGATGASVEEIHSSNQSFEVRLPIERSILQKEIVNDFVIPTKNPEEKEKHRGRQFQIYYDMDTQKYKIK